MSEQSTVGQFFEKVFGIRSKKQEGLLTSLGLTGQIERDDYVGPDFRKGDTLNLKPTVFLKVIQKRNIQIITAEAGRGDDTYIPYKVFAKIDEDLGLYIKTGATKLLYPAPMTDEYQSLFSKLYELGFRWDPKSHKENWSVYRITK
jgi:hypothetical protein